MDRSREDAGTVARQVGHDAAAIGSLSGNPKLAELEMLRAQGKLRLDQIAAVDHVGQAAAMRDEVLTNAELLHMRGCDSKSIAPRALQRSASFTRCKPILDDLKAMLHGIDMGEPPSEITQAVIEAGLHEIRLITENVQSRVIAQARAGMRIQPFTTVPHRFRWFLEHHQLLLNRIIAACSLSGEPRCNALQDALTELAHAYFNAADIPAPTDRLKVILIPDGQDLVVVGEPQPSGIRDLRIALTTHGVDHPGVDPLAALQRRGLASLLTGFERKSTATRQGASYLQCFFHEMTRLEEQAKIVFGTRGHAHPMSRMAGRSREIANRSREELTYKGDAILGDTPTQRGHALAPVRRFAAAMATGDCTTPTNGVVKDSSLRTWLKSARCDRDLMALLLPAARMPIAQEPIARVASMPRLDFHS